VHEHLSAHPDLTVPGNDKMRVAFIVQRCGLEVNGGAELHCRQVAQRMSKYWETEVLTTCAVDYMTWSNFYPPGLVNLNGVSVRRFSVDKPRDVDQFNRLSAELQARQSYATIEEQEQWMQRQGPISSSLQDYLIAEKDNYDAFVFFGYLYATSYFGLPLVREKAYLAPLAHDEWPIYFTLWNKFFSLPNKLIFNTTFEREFLQQRFAGVSLKGRVIGVGINPPAHAEAKAFRARYKLEDRFLLYVGRIDESKGCRCLLENFIRAREAGAIQTKLVLIGQEVMPIPFHDDVIHLGFLDEQEKWDAMAACDWLVMPSPNESLSMVLLEAWAMGRPALVTAEAEVLKGQCRRANAGLWYRDYDEFETILRTIDDSTKTQLGENGRRFVAAEYSWDRVEQDYLDLLQPTGARTSTAPCNRRG
jgi:glycosyltransferase involved in cell wall biosynthesis